MAFILSVSNKATSRHAFLNDDIIKSLDQIHGFKDSAIYGDVDGEVVRHVTQCMTLGPQLQDVTFRMAEHLSHGEHFFEQKEYTLAERYLGIYLPRQTPSREIRYSFKDFIETTVPFFLKAELAKQMIDLHTYRNDRLTRNTTPYPLAMIQGIIERHTRNYRISPVLQAKFWICQSVAQFAVGGPESFHDSRNSRIMAVTILCRDNRFAGQFVAISRELKWARNNYLEQQRDRLTCSESKEPTLMLETHGEVSERRSLWAWLDLSE
jgi:hypothetical protein